MCMYCIVGNFEGFNLFLDCQMYVVNLYEHSIRKYCPRELPAIQYVW